MSTKNSFFNIDYIEFKHMHCKEAQHKKKPLIMRKFELFHFLQVKDKDEKLLISQATVASKK